MSETTGCDAYALVLDLLTEEGVLAAQVYVALLLLAGHPGAEGMRQRVESATLEREGDDE